MFSHLKDGTYKYGSAKPDQWAPGLHYSGNSIVLPAIFLHRAYLEMMFDEKMVAKELVEYIDQIMNCDDILMSVVVTKFLKDCGWPQSGGLQLEVKKLKMVEGMSKCV